MPRRPQPRRRRRRAREPWWIDLPLDELLDVRLCDLGLRIEGTALEARVQRLHDELARAGLRFRPYVWLSTDWFTPDGSTGFAIPFYLAHPRLVRLEHAQMLEAEGSTGDECMRLLRHEAGHALDNAYRLHRRAAWRRTFGRYSEPYRLDYHARPDSKDYVQHLDRFYAQSHPAEDYAETFAVWLAPGARWQRDYEGWPALKKLEALDAMMADVAGRPQAVRSRDRSDSLPTLKATLRDYYRRKQASYANSQPWMHDRELVWLFRPAARRGGGRGESAATFLRNLRVDLRGRTASLTGHYRYVVDQALDAMIARCKELDLRRSRSAALTRLGAAVLLTMVTLTLTLPGGKKPRFRR
ncbi:MAG: putative zinc-binding metallopeptidase [Planctomycetota bacterium]